MIDILPRIRRLNAWLLPLAALIAASIAAPRPASAHPHAWIDVKVKVLFDEKGRVYALEETWVFDPMYTAFSLEGVKRDKDGRPDQRAIDALMAENMKNIKEYNYLTEVDSNGAKAAFSGVRGVRGSHEGKRLHLTFTLLLEKPVEAEQAPVRYAVFDPTYYIEMLHAEGGGAIELVGAGAGCLGDCAPGANRGHGCQRLGVRRALSAQGQSRCRKLTVQRPRLDLERLRNSCAVRVPRRATPLQRVSAASPGVGRPTSSPCAAPLCC